MKHLHLGECFSVNNMFNTRKADENFSIENFQILSKLHRRLKRMKFSHSSPNINVNMLINMFGNIGIISIWPGVKYHIAKHLKGHLAPHMFLDQQRTLLFSFFLTLSEINDPLPPRFKTAPS